LIHIAPSTVAAWGGAAVFANVLATRLGVPLPAVPLLLFAGSAIANGTLLFSHVFFAAVLAALIGDGVWFSAGRVYGRRLINVLTRISLTVDTSVRRTRALFERFGVPIVAVSKFVPGLALITPPLMGTTLIAPVVFVLWDTVGTIAWAAFWLLGGAVFERQLAMLVRFLEPYGGTIADVLVTLAVLYLSYRYLLRWSANRWRAHIHVSAAQLDYLLRSKAPPVVLDARFESIRNRERYRIPGAVLLDLKTLDNVEPALLTRDMVVYCVCPNDATARKVRQRLRAKGFTHVHVLKGGLDNWMRHGLPIEALPPLADEGVAGQQRKWPRRALARHPEDGGPIE
jgi:membrane protein DedA with SNARE-associated domain/rhodanese-related sulfurtransferase